MKKNRKTQFKISIELILLSVFLTIITITTLMFLESSKIKKEVFINISDKTYVENLSVNNNTYLMKKYLQYDSLKEKYYLDEDLSFQITNNDFIKIESYENFTVSIDNEIINASLNEENGTYTLKTSIDKYRIFTQTLNNYSKIKLFFVTIFFTFLYLFLIKLVLNFFDKIYLKNKFDIKLYVLSMISLFIIYYFNMRTLINIFGFYSGFLIAFIFLYLILKYRKSKNFNYYNNYLLIAIIIGISIMFINPPFNVLDENNHYSKVNNQFIIKGKMNFDENGKFYTYQSSEVYNFITKYNENLFLSNDKDSIMGSYEEYITYETNADVKISYGTFAAQQLAYIPAMLMAHTSKLLNLNIYLSFMLSRFINLMIFIFICFNALKLIPKYKHLLFLICSFSILIQQGMGINQDWLNNCSLIMLISYIFYLIFEKEKIDKKDYLILGILNICLAFSKTIYTVFSLLVIFIPNNKFNENKNKIFNKSLLKKILIIGFAGLITILSYKWNNLFLKMPVDTTYGKDYYTWSYGLSHPFWMISIIFNSLKHFCHLYFFLGYFKDFGWYKVSFQPVVTIIIALIYLFLIFSQPREKYESKKNELLFKFVNLSIFGIVSCLIACSMLFGWTKAGSALIDGMQPRYFLPAIFSAYLIFDNKLINFKKINLEKITTYIVIIINVISVMYMINGFYF